MSQLRDLKSVIAIQQPKTLVFGAGCAGRCPDDLAAKGFRRVFVVSSPSVVKMAEPLLAALRGKLAHVAAYSDIRREPTIAMFDATLRAARDFSPDCVVGIGGGSPLDVAKLVAALHSSSQSVAEVFGIGKLATRSTHLACLPTTAGTGSEVSPNAILLDESAQLKKGVISPHLMPDATYADPQLTLTVPPNVTAATGLDALTHCIEAYVNKLAHPMIDLYALEGIRLIGRSLGRAFDHGDDLDARADVLLGSLYGGMCLGPVNTGAVHALSYPLGGEFHIPHGVANSMLLPHVLKFNLPAATRRYANVAVALGVDPIDSPAELAERGLERICELSGHCRIPQRLSELGIPEAAIERLAAAGMTVTRLLERNVREVTLADAIMIYRSAY
jgi:alcohol dehydrogenase